MATFNIFEGEIAHNPVCVAHSKGIEAAKAAMERMANERPGKYFVWESRSNQVLAMTDTTKPSANSQ